MKTTSDNGVWGLQKLYPYTKFYQTGIRGNFYWLILAHYHIVVIYEMVLLNLGPILSAMRDY